MLPVANAREPCRAATTRKALRTATRKVHLAIPVEHVAFPDLLDRDVVGIREELGRAKRNVLAAKRDATERINVQALEGPNARLLALCGKVSVEMLVQRFAVRNGSVVVPRQKLSRDYFIDADVFEPEVDRFL